MNPLIEVRRVSEGYDAACRCCGARAVFELEVGHTFHVVVIEMCERCLKKLHEEFKRENP